MRLLLDTHIVLWWMVDDRRLSPEAADAISTRDNRVLVSVVSLWEIAIKVRARKLAVDVAELDRAIAAAGFERLPIAPAHLTTLLSLPAPHRDPFDHLLIAQSISEAATLISVDRSFSRYPVSLLK